MKKSKLGALMLCGLLCTGIWGTSVDAADKVADGLAVSFTANNEEYTKTENIETVLSVTNLSDNAVTNVTLNTLMPDGYQLVAGSENQIMIEELPAGETQELTTVLQVSVGTGNENPGEDGQEEPDSENPGGSVPDKTQDSDSVNSQKDSTKGGSDGVDTGDNTNALFWIGLLFISGVIVIIVLKKKKGKQFLSMILCFAITGSMFGGISMDAEAAESTQKKIEISEKVIVDGEELNLSAEVLYELQEEETLPDEDGDGVADIIEDHYGSDSSKEDTDGDGLSDYIEIYVTMTDSTVKDTDGNGVADGDEDLDGDGLTNLKELEYGTDLAKADTDSDGLNDSVEVFTYGTDPTLYDTDGDTISDGDEILLGLDPLSVSSDGVTNDADRRIEQTLSTSRIDGELLEAENSLQPSVSGSVSGNMDNAVTLERAEIEALADNRAVNGYQVYINTEYPEGSGLQIHFSCASDERKDFYIICRYEDGEIVPCETTVTETDIWTEAAAGYYFVMDAEKLLQDLDIPINEYINAAMEESTSAYSVEMPDVQGDSDGNDLSPEWYEENYVYVDADGNPIEEPDGMTVMDIVGEDAEAEENTDLDEADGQAVLDEADGNAPSVQSKEAENDDEGVSSKNGRTVEAYSEADGRYMLASALENDGSTMDTEAIARMSAVSGQADIVFVIDTTGSMSGAINNVVRNIEDFVDVLASNYSVNANFALVEYGDITIGEPTSVVKNGNSNWFYDVENFKDAVGSLYPGNGGDANETALDGLGAAYSLDFRASANKFVILVTDALSKINNNYGISSVEEMAEMFEDAGIVTSVISANSCRTQYLPLFVETGGVFGNIYGDFSSLLAEMAGNIGEIVNDGSWVILKDYQYIKLDAPVSADSGTNSDDDDYTDYEELGEAIEKDLTSFIKLTLAAYGVPFELYRGETSITVYDYTSNPVLTDSDFDGIIDSADTDPLSNKFDGRLITQYFSSPVEFEVDYRAFFKNNTNYNSDLSVLSELLSASIYKNAKIDVYGGNSCYSSYEDDLVDILTNFGIDAAQLVNISGSDVHKTECAFGYHDVEYKGRTLTVVPVVVRGTNGTLDEWTSNFDIGDTRTDSADWETKENHKGFDVAANRVLNKLEDFEKEYLEGKNIVYWVTGHSRGAAIANLIGAYLADDGKTAFTYTFAAPNTTTSSSKTADNYNAIFNVINTDDFVPCLPMSQWEFGLYGRKAPVSIADNYEKEWENLTGDFDYNPDNNMTDVVDTLATIANNRNECYEFTWKSDTAVEQYFSSESARDNAKQKLIDLYPENTVDYYAFIDSYASTHLINKYGYQMYQTPMFLMQILAAVMSNDFSAGNYATMDVAKYLEPAKWAVVGAKVSGIAEPHYTESYYVLAKNVSADDFN